MSLNQPESLNPHDAAYKPMAWADYTLAELGWWVHLLTKRAGMRADPVKRAKDFDDAANYLSMMRAKLDEAKGGGA